MKESVIRLCFIIFRDLGKKWNLSYDQVGDMIEQYKLVSYVEEHEEELNEYGIGGILMYMIEPYIISQGGVLDTELK